MRYFVSLSSLVCPHIESQNAAMHRKQDVNITSLTFKHLTALMYVTPNASNHNSGVRL